MSRRPDAQTLDTTVRTLRIIGFALAMGVLLLHVGGWFLLVGNQPAADQRILSILAVAMTFVMSIVQFVVPELIARKTVASAHSQPKAADLLAVYQAKTIVRMALLEAPGMLAGIALIVERQRWTPVLGIIVICAILMAIPSRHRIEHWVETQQFD